MVAGIFHGKEAVLKHLTQPAKAGASMKLTPRAFFGDEQYGAVLCEITTILGSNTLTETRIMVCKVEDAKVVETRIYRGDQYALDDFLS